MAMIAENFYRYGFDLFRPQINWAGDSPGYVGTEFPLVPFLAALFYIPFGVHETIGRAISLFFATISFPVFYLLVKQFFGRRAAFIALGFYLISPLNIYYTRTFQPESAMIFFSIAMLYFFVRWLEGESKRDFIWAVIFANLAFLVKIPSLILAIPLFYLAWCRYRTALFYEKTLWLFVGLILPLPLLWYSHAFSLAYANYPYNMFGDKEWALRRTLNTLVMGEFYKIVGLNIVTVVLTPIGFLMALGGFLIPVSFKGGMGLFHIWMIAIVLYMLIGAWGNMTFGYYQLPLIPPATALIGRFGAFMQSMNLFPPMILIGLLLLTGYFSFTYVKPYYYPQDQVYLETGRGVDRLTPHDALIIAVDEGNPALLYYSRRKGWHFPEEHGIGWGNFTDGESAIRNLEALRQRGGAYLVIPSRFFWVLTHLEDFGVYLDRLYQRLVDDPSYMIYDLREESRDHNGEKKLLAAPARR